MIATGENKNNNNVKRNQELKKGQNGQKNNDKVRKVHNDEPLTQNQKNKWEVAFKAEEAHLGSQRKFHTVEFDRYENRDKMYAAEKEAWNQDTDLRTRFQAVMEANRKHKGLQNDINATIDRYQKARQPFLDVAQAARRNAVHPNEEPLPLNHKACENLSADFKIIPNHQAAINRKGKLNENKAAGNDAQISKEVAKNLNKLWNAYVRQATQANNLQKKFHVVEFKEFDERQKCVNKARKLVDNPKITQKAVVDCYKGGLQKVNEDVRKAEVNVADK